jgi:hypothetical protein
LSDQASPARLSAAKITKLTVGQSLLNPADCFNETAQPASRKPETIRTSQATVALPVVKSV